MANNLKCLTNLVGYKTPCETSVSRSGYYVNQVRGVSFKFAENIADEEYKTGKEFITGLLDQASNMVLDEMEMNLRPYFKQNTLQDSSCLCAFTDGYMAAYTGERGVEIHKLDLSPYKKLYVGKVSVCIQDTATITMKINDGGTIVSFDPVEVIGGALTEIMLDYSCSFDTVKIYFDQTGIAVRNTSCLIGCAGCGNRRSNNENTYLRIFGFDQSNVVTTNQFFGFIPCVSVECVTSNLVCDFSKYLGLPVLYKWAGLFYGEVATSKRINKYTLHTKEEAVVMASYYDNPDEENPGVHQKQMRSVINSISPYLNSIQDDCITCNANHYGWVTG